MSKDILEKGLEQINEEFQNVRQQILKPTFVGTDSSETITGTNGAVDVVYARAGDVI